ncbi:MAG: hypothetical protein J6Z22_01120 [Lachnospiraceae bacterium]|nr:hypothetical protein [Lachnospiraceae bacterium]
MNPFQRNGASRRPIRQEGTVGDLLSALLCILGMIAVMVTFMDCVALVNRKTMVGQIARNYVLKMETVGYLTPVDEEALLRELAALEIDEVSLAGTTRTPVEYGAEITLSIRGRMGEDNYFEEKRVSTAKH